jgi:hypothetical protein
MQLQHAIPPGLNPLVTGGALNGDGTVALSFAGLAGTNYCVEAPSNLAQPVWQVLSTNLAGADGFWNFTDLTATNYSQRFYRACKP